MRRFRPVVVGGVIFSIFSVGFLFYQPKIIISSWNQFYPPSYQNVLSWSPSLPPHVPDWSPSLPPHVPDWSPSLPPHVPDWSPSLPPHVPDWSPSLPPHVPDVS